MARSGTSSAVQRMSLRPAQVRNPAADRAVPSQSRIRSAIASRGMIVRRPLPTASSRVEALR
jgi:hypothetical protein